MSIIPRSFLTRTILLVLLPLIVALLIVTNAFFGNHWKRVHATLANTLSGEIATLIHFMDKGDEKSVSALADDIGIQISVNDTVNRPQNNDNESREAGQLAKDLQRI